MGAGAGGASRGADEREAGLIDPVAGDGADAGAGGLLEGAEEIVGGGVALAVVADVLAHTGAEDGRPDVLLQHEQDGSALLVSDGVKHLAGLGGALDGRVDGASGGKGVGIEGGGLLLLEVDPDVPIGAPVGDRAELDPGGEGLVEPEIVPPLHGDEVAEPLVGDLVRDDEGDTLLGSDRGGGGIAEQGGLAEEDGAGFSMAPASKSGTARRSSLP